MARRCLYYPFIHFRDEGWLKLSALYWDDVSRIVPRAYAPRDSRDVRTLEDAGVLRRVDPATYEPAVSRLFNELIERHERKLVARYDVARRDGWPKNLERFSVSTGRSSAQSLAFIHCSKLERGLLERLLELRLALPSRDRRWLGMHPSIVSAYMIALAGEIGRRRGLSPSSDNAMHVSGVTSCSVEDLARSLVAELDLGKRRRKGREHETTSERVAFVTLRTVLPERLDGVPARRIIELRERHAGARHAFHGYVEEVRAQLAGSDICEPRALDEHIRLEYRRRLEPELHELGRGLSSLGVGTFLGVFGVAVTLPIGSLLGASPAAALAAAGGSALGLAALSHKQRDAARGLLKPSPASFLFLTEQLRHRSLGRRVAESVRRFTLGV
jgi:hypothetical protein